MRLESLLAAAAPPLHLTPATQDLQVAADWFSRFEGAGLDGVMAKPISGDLSARQARDVQGQARARLRLRGRGLSMAQGRSSTAVGSLLLGLFDDAGALQHVGVCASFTDANADELVEFLAPYRRDALADHPWKRGRSMPRRAAKPGIGCRAARAAGVRARIFPGNRCGRNWWSRSHTSICKARAFRHMAQFRRWRPDKKPERLHLCATGSGSAAGADGDFFHGR